jgi:hypothetical protein
MPILHWLARWDKSLTQQACLASNKQPSSGTTTSPPSLAQASPLWKEFLPIFIRHALLPSSSVIFILTVINIYYTFTWLSLWASTSHIIYEIC